MAHFAKISDTNEVLTVLTLTNANTEDSNGVEDETVGQHYLEKHNNWPTAMWIQTSYNTQANQHGLGGTPLRGNFASTGYEWDAANQIFWPVKLYPSWVKDVPTASWKSPIGDPPALTDEQIADPDNRYLYSWNEENQSWNLDSYDKT